MKKPGFINKHVIIRVATLGAAVCIFLAALFLLWVSSWRIPTLDSFSERSVSQSTKIYDRTGQVVLYDVYQNARRTVVPFDQISPNVKTAVLAIEDVNFYNHGGIQFTSIIRAILANITGLGFAQGGSTITQQVIKNSLLTNEKQISRKIKEWVLAPKLEKIMTKDQIFAVYLNEIPFGGSIYGVEEASQEFFGVSSKDVDLAQAAYLAALPQAPTYYSPYGPNKKALDDRKNLVLSEMLKNNLITKDQYNKAKAEVVRFRPQEDFGIKAPHFVMEVRSQLVQKYGEQALDEGGLKVITTLNYDLEKKAEDMALAQALKNKITFNAENIGLVAIDPKNGDILSMVGSRDYFDKQIDGNFNITTAHRQPGSAFKPFVYAQAFIRGYTPDTIVYDLPTEFSTTCSPTGQPLSQGANCYMPGDYDGKYRGPMTMRDAIAQSVNVASIQTFYLAGLQQSLDLARSMGIQSLGDINQYGLTLVLGGGEVSLLDLTSAYGVFANEGVRNPYRYILEVDDKDGNVLYKAPDNPTSVLDPKIADEISDVLSDEQARSPAFGFGSPLFFPGRDVAVKTGTTNDYKDALTVGYTPDVVVGAWAGNNNNTSMEKKIAAFIIAPYWHAVMNEALKIVPDVKFARPPSENNDYSLKPILRGKWQGGISSIFNGQEILSGGVHNILYWVNKDDPRGPAPVNPANDPQFERWELPVRNWALAQGYANSVAPALPTLPTGQTNPQNPSNLPNISITNPNSPLPYNINAPINVGFQNQNSSPAAQITRAEYYVNNQLIGTSVPPFNFSFTPVSVNVINRGSTNTLKVVVYDAASDRVEASIQFLVSAN